MELCFFAQPHGANTCVDTIATDVYGLGLVITAAADSASEETFG